MSRMGPFLLSGDRVGIRRPTEDDEAEFVALMRASAALHEPWGEYPTTPEQFRGYLRRRRAADADGFLVCELAGEAGVSDVARDDAGHVTNATPTAAAIARPSGRDVAEASAETADIAGAARPRGAIAGVININSIVRGCFHSGYLGYYAGAPFARRGYMTEGLRLVTRFAFAELKLHRVEANIQPGNVASIALARRCGFRLEGYSPRYLHIRGAWRDHERWALLADDPPHLPPCHLSSAVTEG